MKIIPASAPVPKPARVRAIPEKTDVITACGCVCVPWPVWTLLGDDDKRKSVMCDRHGWQRIIRPATVRERNGLGTPFPFPDDPPY